MVPDSIPVRTDAVYCPSYCLIRDGSRLTMMSSRCARRATELMLDGRASYAIFSSAYDGQEGELRKTMAAMAGIDAVNVVVLPAARDSYHEAVRLARIFKERRIRSLTVVADAHHMRRVLGAFHVAAPEVAMRSVSFSPEQYEMTREPSLLKSIRACSKLLWALWNAALVPFTAVFVKRAAGKQRAT